MKLQQSLDSITSYLTQNLAGYEVIPAKFGWHIHKGNTYFGLLQYQETKGWHGSAFSNLPLEVKERLKKFKQWNSSQIKLTA
ncbi:MAG TPA: hypothetical protein V6D11_02100 [Waterburya sp.]|jgi:hypothetical protein